LLPCWNSHITRTGPGEEVLLSCEKLPQFGHMCEMLILPGTTSPQQQHQQQLQHQQQPKGGVLHPQDNSPRHHHHHSQQQLQQQQQQQQQEQQQQQQQQQQHGLRNGNGYMEQHCPFIDDLLHNLCKKPKVRDAWTSMCASGLCVCVRVCVAFIGCTCLHLCT